MVINESFEAPERASTGASLSMEKLEKEPEKTGEPGTPVKSSPGAAGYLQDKHASGGPRSSSNGVLARGETSSPPKHRTCHESMGLKRDFAFHRDTHLGSTSCS